MLQWAHQHDCQFLRKREKGISLKSLPYCTFIILSVGVTKRAYPLWLNLLRIPTYLLNSVHSGICLFNYNPVQVHRCRFQGHADVAILIIANITRARIILLEQRERHNSNVKTRSHQRLITPPEGGSFRQLTSTWRKREKYQTTRLFYYAHYGNILIEYCRADYVRTTWDTTWYQVFTRKNFTRKSIPVPTAL